MPDKGRIQFRTPYLRHPLLPIAEESRFRAVNGGTEIAVFNDKVFNEDCWREIEEHREVEATGR
jgi:hypothetical protein